jgi:rubrerythrin
MNPDDVLRSALADAIEARFTENERAGSDEPFEWSEIMASNDAMIERYQRALKELDERASEKVYACGTCGSTEIQGTAWYEINSGRMMNDEGPTDQTWCPECDTDEGIEMVEVEQGENQ